MQFSKGVGIFLIICTVVSLSEAALRIAGGFFKNAALQEVLRDNSSTEKPAVDKNYAVYEQQTNGDVHVRNGNQVVVIPASKQERVLKGKDLIQEPDETDTAAVTLKSEPEHRQMSEWSTYVPPPSKSQ